MEIQLPPGVVKTKSDIAAVGRYVEADHVRWVGGLPEKISGWVRLFETELAGVPRAAHAWRAPSGFEIFAFATEQKLYSDEYGSEPEDITPLRSTAALVNPFGTTNGSAVVTVTDTAHGAITGDTVHFSGASAVAGITVDGEYVLTVVDDDHYQVTHSASANATTTGGGAVTADYEINIGAGGSSESGGYGSGGYGMEDYGEERTLTTITIDGRHWTLGNYGDNLIGGYQGSTIYLWDQDVDTRAVALSGAPIDLRAVFVTEERFIFALCENLVVNWADVDDPTDWTPSDTNTANTRRLAIGNKLMAGTSLGGGLSLVWTDTALYLFQYTGGQFVYASRMISNDCGLIGPGAFCTADGIAFWICDHGFQLFNGSAQSVPNSGDVHAWFFGNMTMSQKAKCTSWFDSKNREVWFTAPLFDATEPSHYVYVNIDDWHWGAGTLDRTCATMSSTQGLLLGSSNGRIYQHDVGVDDDEDSLPTTLRSGLSRLPGATVSMDIFGVAPDFERQDGDIQFRLFGRDRANSASEDSQTVTLTTETEMADVRVRGRYVGFEITQDELGGDWRMGVPVVETQPAGARR